MAKITYDDKVAINTNSGIPDVNKVTDTNMNDIKGAINQLGNYNAVTAGNNGDFYATLKGTISSGDIFFVSVPNATTASSNARISVTGAGGTFYNIKDTAGQNVIASLIQNKKISVYFDGTNLVYKEVPALLWSGNGELNDVINLNDSIFKYRMVIIKTSISSITITIGIIPGFTTGLYGFGAYSNTDNSLQTFGIRCPLTGGASGAGTQLTIQQFSNFIHTPNSNHSVSNATGASIKGIYGIY